MLTVIHGSVPCLLGSFDEWWLAVAFRMVPLLLLLPPPPPPLLPLLILVVVVAVILITEIIIVVHFITHHKNIPSSPGEFVSLFQTG